MRCRQRSKELHLGFGEIEPRRPVIPLKDDHLSIMYRRDVGSGRRCEEGKGVAGPVQASAASGPRSKTILASFGELPFLI
jgi:hypothetical protein